MAWLLPSLFDDKQQSLQPLDHWLESFGMVAGGRRDSMANALVLAHLMQRLLVRATDKEIDTAAKLIEESKASSLLRRVGQSHQNRCLCLAGLGGCQEPEQQRHCQQQQHYFAKGKRPSATIRDQKPTRQRFVNVRWVLQDNLIISIAPSVGRKLSGA